MHYEDKDKEHLRGELAELRHMRQNPEEVILIKIPSRINDKFMAVGSRKSNGGSVVLK